MDSGGIRLEDFEILIFAVWLFPIFVSFSILYGYLRYKICLGKNYQLNKIIIQITTVANFNIVNRNIATIRSYALAVPYEIWVVTESELVGKYHGADKVLHVPASFGSIAKYKSRALDYSSGIRRNLGIDSSEVKILFLDDDTIPSRDYVEMCFVTDIDIIEGIIEPTLNYGTLYSYVDNMRTLACMSVCSIFQSHGHPVWVHGEGMCIRASVEQEIGWQFDVIASEDLVFGHACAAKKLKWGFIWKPIFITSPWTFKDFFKQRKRWIWGNVHAMVHILTWRSKVRVLWFHIMGASTPWITIIGSIADLTGIISFTSTERIFIYTALIVWLGTFGYIGYVVGNGSLRHILLSMALAWYTTIMNVFPIWVGLFFKKPREFEVITKEHEAADKHE